MISTLRNRAVLAALALALFGLGCESGTEPSAQPTLEVESSPSNLLGGLLGGSDDGDALEFLERTSSLLVEQVVTQLVGSDGATLELFGHSLVIPAGAVEKPTYFVMIVLPGNQVQVELYAIDAATGLDVGASGFKTAVQLALSYSDVNGIKDPSKLVIVHVTGDGEPVELKTRVDTGAETASADLKHFSRYALCRN